MGLALSGWASVDVNLSTSQGKPTSRSTVGIQISWAVVNMTSLGLTILLA